MLVGSDGRPRVADFGLARGGGTKTDDATVQSEEGAASRSGGHLLISPLTQYGTIMGTPMYMSPENTTS